MLWRSVKFWSNFVVSLMTMPCKVRSRTAPSERHEFASADVLCAEAATAVLHVLRKLRHEVEAFVRRWLTFFSRSSASFAQVPNWKDQMNGSLIDKKEKISFGRISETEKAIFSKSVACVRTMRPSGSRAKARVLKPDNVRSMTVTTAERKPMPRRRSISCWTVSRSARLATETGSPYTLRIESKDLNILHLCIFYSTLRLVCSGQCCELR